MVGRFRIGAIQRQHGTMDPSSAAVTTRRAVTTQAHRLVDEAPDR